MLTLTVLRHGSTAWNERGLMQGRRDIPLSAHGRAQVATWRVPPDVSTQALWASSPLCRAVETASILAGAAPQIEPALTEMDWGEWEGHTLHELRTVHAEAFADSERRGLDFRPPRGESPRDVLLRVQQWVRALALRGRPTIAVTHKGVMRALLVAATGWRMIDKPPVKLQPGCMHIFGIDGDTSLSLVRCNIPLATVAATEHID